MYAAPGQFASQTWVVDTAVSGSIPATWALPNAGTTAGSGAAVAPDGSQVYFAVTGGAGLNILDLASGTFSRIELPGRWPSGVALPPSQSPVAAVGDVSGGVGEAVTLDASATTASSGLSIVEYVWDFGDGTRATTTTPTVEHAYDAAGEYALTVTVTDSAGTSTDVVYNGSRVLRNGSGAATASGTATITAPEPTPEPTDPTPEPTEPTAPSPEPTETPAPGPSTPATAVADPAPSPSATDDDPALASTGVPAVIAWLGGAAVAVFGLGLFVLVGRRRREA